MNDNENTREEINEIESASNQESLIPNSENQSTTAPPNTEENGTNPSTAGENGMKYSEELPTNPEYTSEDGSTSATEPKDHSEQKSKNAGRGIMTVGIMLSAISIILMLAISTCILIGLVDSLGKVAFIPVAGIPYYSNNTDDSQVIADAMESVVVISIETETGGGTGSGVILSANGYIVTNYHVIEDATAIYVQLHGSPNNIKAELIGYSEHDDVAVIKIDKTGLKPAIFVSD